jgi:putative ABC transport system permease protein
VRHAGLNREPAPTVYTSFLQQPEPRMSLVVRAAVPPLALTGSVKNAVYAVDKDQPMYKIRSMDEVVSHSQSESRFTLVVLGIFAAVALTLASVGIYGVISYSVAQRRHEIGVRMAVGAQPRHVLLLVVGQGMLLAVAGTAAGVAVALGATQLMSSMLFGVSPRDPLIFAATPAILGVVALLSSYLPARRAAALDPMSALRQE